MRISDLGELKDSDLITFGEMENKIISFLFYQYEHICVSMLGLTCFILEKATQIEYIGRSELVGLPYGGSGTAVGEEMGLKAKFCHKKIEFWGQSKCWLS